MNPNKPVITLVLAVSFVGYELLGHVADHESSKHIEPSTFEPAATQEQTIVTSSGLFSGFTGSDKFNWRVS